MLLLLLVQSKRTLRYTIVVAFALLTKQGKTSRLLLFTVIFVLCHVEIRDRDHGPLHSSWVSCLSIQRVKPFHVFYTRSNNSRVHCGAVAVYYTITMLSTFAYIPVQYGRAHSLIIKGWRRVVWWENKMIELRDVRRQCPYLATATLIPPTLPCYAFRIAYFTTSHKPQSYQHD